MSLSAEELDGNQFLARSLARMEAYQQKIERLEKVEAAARAFVDFLSANAVTNAEWPIENKFDMAVAEPLLLSIRALDRALAKQTPESPLPAGTALDCATILAIRQRVVAMYEHLDELSAKCVQDPDGGPMSVNLQHQIMGMRKVRQMLGAMLDEQAGIPTPYAHVDGLRSMPAPTQAALSDLASIAQEEIEEGRL